MIVCDLLLASLPRPYLPRLYQGLRDKRIRDEDIRDLLLAEISGLIKTLPSNAAMQS